MSAPDGQPHPVVYVRIRQRRNIATVVRGQTWFWETVGANNSRMARSHGFHTNQQDCIDSATLHFGYGTTVYLQQTEQGDVLLRWGTSLPGTGD
jgi:hypothetical protein